MTTVILSGLLVIGVFIWVSFAIHSGNTFNIVMSTISLVSALDCFWVVFNNWLLMR